jgi:hypothetical protein
MSRSIPLIIAGLLTASFQLTGFAASSPASGANAAATEAQARTHFKVAKRQAKDAYRAAMERCKALPTVQRVTCEKDAKAAQKAQVTHARKIRKAMKESATATKH